MVKIAYLILCHKNAKQINKLIEMLNSSEVTFFIHLDAKVNIEERITKASNIYLLPESKRVDIKWGDISMIQATQNLMESALSYPEAFDYLWLLSGQDLPIKKPKEINKYLENNFGKNFIEIIDESNDHYSILNKRNELSYPNWMRKMSFLSRLVKNVYVLITGGRSKTIIFKRKNSLKIRFYFGSQWWTLTYDCAKEIYEMLKDKKIINYYKHCLVPDESVIQTLFMQSSFKDTHVEKLTLVDWTNQINHPKTFTVKDYEKLINSKYLMARKFDESVDDNIIEMIYQRFK